MIAETESQAKKTIKQIFNQYFRTKFIVCGILFIISSIAGYFNGHHTLDWTSTAVLLAVLTLSPFILGYMDYYFYEKEAPKLVFKLIGESPLKEFCNRGFVYEEENKMTGCINNFNIVLAPLVNNQRKNFLMILIPLKVEGEAEKYFTDIDEVFKFNFIGNVLMARAVIENFTKDYDFEKLFDLLTKATDLLIERKIEPLEIIED